MIVGDIDAFGGIVERPLELDIRRICVHTAFDLSLFLFCNAIDALLIGRTGRSICRMRKAHTYRFIII